MTDMSLGSWIRRRAERTPNRTAIVFDGCDVTYAQLDDRIRRLALVLRGLGVRHGDRVGYLGPNNPAFLESLFAAASIGAIAVPVNHALPAGTVQSIVADAGCRVLICGPGTVDAGERLTAAMPSCTPVFLDQRERGRDYESLLASAESGRLDSPVALDDPALLVYTSGTTGPPKGVTLTHGNLTWNVFNFLVGGDFRHDDVTLAIAPFFRMGAIGVTVLETLLLGGTVVIMPKFEPGEALRLIEQHRVTLLFGGPDLLQALLDHEAFSEAGFSSVRVCITGGAPVPRHLIDEYLRRGIPIIQGYGLSEAAPLALLLDPQDITRKIGSAGRPAFFCDVRVVDADGRECAPGDVGEVLVAGPNVMKGYWNREVVDEHLLDGRWLRTGDSARTDQEGYVTMVGRMADAYVASGGIVHPGDIEAVLREHPDVVDAAVVGVPDAHTGHVGVAFVEAAEATPVPDAILTWAAERIAPEAMPRSIHVLDRLPRNPAGKILRRELSERGHPA